MLRVLGVMFAMTMLLGCPQEKQEKKKPAETPVDIDACNVDADCTIGIVCDCNGCVARNKSAHVDICPVACETSPCDGKRPACVAGRCQAVQ